MDHSEGRRSRVPLGTFGGSEPPPPPEPADTDTAASAPEGRPRFASTLAGENVPAHARDEPARAFPSTLVGQPGAVAAVAFPSLGPPAPVLAPPKWRGAQAYQGGEEPKPQVSSIPTPAPYSLSPARSGSPSLPSKVTTKVGLPQAVVAPLHADSARELPIDDIDELDLDDVLEGESVADPAPASATHRTEPVEDPAAVVQPLDRPEPLPLAPAAPAAVPLAAIRLRRQTTSGTPARELVERSSDRAFQPGGSPIAPAAVQPALRPVPGPAAPRAPLSDLRLGALLVAAMVVLGLGGWLLTAGGYVRRVAAVKAPEPPASQAQDVTASSVTPPAQGSVQEPVPQAPPVVAAADPSGKQQPVRDFRSDRPTPDPPSETNSPAPEPPASSIRITPRGASGALPEIPSRDDVLAALEALRNKIEDCVDHRGVAQLDITVVNTGSVTNVVVGGDFAGTQAGSCIARVARSARFVPFSKPRFRVIFPFSL